MGAGLAGLSAAKTLIDAGFEVRILEASATVGGRVQSDEINGYRLDRGFQLINANYPELRSLNIVDAIDFISAPRCVDIALDGSVVRLGAPRKYVLSAFNTQSGTIVEKLAFLKYLVRKSSQNSSVESELLSAGCGKLYTTVLKPFLTGVFLSDPSRVDAIVGR